MVQGSSPSTSEPPSGESPSGCLAEKAPHTPAALSAGPRSVTPPPVRLVGGRQVSNRPPDLVTRSCDGGGVSWPATGADGDAKADGPEAGDGDLCKEARAASVAREAVAKLVVPQTEVEAILVVKKLVWHGTSEEASLFRDSLSDNVDGEIAMAVIAELIERWEPGIANETAYRNLIVWATAGLEVVLLGFPGQGLATACAAELTGG